MSAESAFVRSWRVGSKYRATLSCPRPRPGAVISACLEWEPSVPPSLTPAEVQEYRAGRAAALADLARELNVTVGVLEL